MTQLSEHQTHLGSRPRPQGKGSVSLPALLRTHLTLHLDNVHQRPGGALIFLLFFYAAYAAILQLSGISIGRWGGDAAAHELAIDYGVVGNSNADYLVMTLGRFFKIGDHYGAVPTILLIIMLAATSIKSRINDIIVISILVLPTLFQMQFASKEGVLILAWFSLLTVLIFTKGKFGRFLACLSIILLLAFSFRKYYFISAAIFLLIYYIRSPRIMSAGFISGLAAASSIPAVRIPVLLPKFQVAYGLSATSTTKIPVIFPTLGFFGLFGNYFVSLIYCLIPVLSGFRPQELFMQLYSIVILLSSQRALREGERATASLFIAIVLTLPVFIPDVGTFARHIGAALPLLLISLHLGKQRTGAPAVGVTA